jgi:diaminopimelate epimerase
MSAEGASATAPPLAFTKMQGAGNDFVVVDGIAQRFDLTPDAIRRLADRRFGVGCDQVLVVERPTRGDADFRYRIFNADGGEVEQCGNGARCFVVFVRERGLTDRREIRVETRGGLIRPRLVDGGEVEVSVLSMGNPHAVQVVDDVDAAPVAREGPRIEHHPRFPARVNAGYMAIVDRANIRLRVWERGAGETLACGTGACAAVVAGIRRGLLDREVEVALRGGTLSIRRARVTMKRTMRRR